MNGNSNKNGTWLLSSGMEIILLDLLQELNLLRLPSPSAEEGLQWKAAFFFNAWRETVAYGMLGQVKQGFSLLQIPTGCTHWIQ